MNPALQLIEDQEWLTPVEEAVQNAVTETLEAAGDAGKKVQNALNGTWLGHPLHPVLTDIPLGAWTTALMLDAMEVRGARRGIEDAADAAVALGLAGAVGAAVTGLVDWKDIGEKNRHVGFVHGVLNVVVTGLFTGSLISRRRRNRTTGRALALAGWGVMAVSAWVGGELVSRYRNGVDRSREVELPPDWIPLIEESELRDGEMKQAEHEGVRVLLLKRGNQIFAIGASCSHRAAPLAEGQLEGDCVICPWHKSKFNIRDGSVIDGPATVPQPKFDVRVRDGRVEVKASHPDV